MTFTSWPPAPVSTAGPRPTNPARYNHGIGAESLRCHGSARQSRKIAISAHPAFSLGREPSWHQLCGLTLVRHGLRYGVDDELFYDGHRPLDDPDELLALLPGVTLDELASYQDRTWDAIAGERLRAVQ